MKRVFNSTLTLANDLVRDHQVHGEPLLPGVAYIDMIYQLATHALGVDLREYRIEDVAISNPLRVREDSPVKLAISFEGLEDSWKVAIEGIPEGEFSGPRKYANATLRKAAIAFTPRLDIRGFLAGAERSVDLEEIYAEARTRGLVHRGSIKAQGIAYVRGADCLIDLSVHEGGDASCAYLVHPALLDGAAMASGVFGRTDKLYIPLHYRSFSCTQPLDTSCWALLRQPTFSRTHDIQKMDIEFYDSDGRQIGELRELATKAVRYADQIHRPSNGTPTTITLSTAPAPVTDTTRDAATIERALRSIYASHLHLKPSDLDLDTGFFELGFESAQLLEVLKEIETAFGTTLNPTLLFEKSNLRELIEHIQQIPDTRPERHTARQASPAVSLTQEAPAFEGTFEFSENEPFLRDHLVFGQAALMGVTHPCLVLECASAGATRLPLTFKGIEFTGGPVTPREGERAAIGIRIDQAGDRTWRFSSHYSEDNTSGSKLCCSGAFLHENEAIRPTIDLKKILAQSKALDEERIEQFYSLVADFAIGPMLRVIESAWVCRDSTLILKASVKGKTQKGTLSSWALDPLLLNACYFLNDEPAERLQNIRIPLFVESLTVFERVPETVYVVNRRRVQKNGYVAFDAMLFNENGDCVTEVINASVKEVTSPELLKNASFVPQPLSGNASSRSHRDRANAADIAVVGLAGRYPQAYDLKAFWEALAAGKDCITEIPEGRWNWKEYYSEDRTKPGRMYSKWGGFIEDMDCFDPRFFGISPREAELMDPQERLFLEHCWMALEDAGYNRQALQSIGAPEMPGNVGVYVGVMSQEYPLYAAEASARGIRMGVASNISTIATRVSFICDLHGPSMAIDTMCSSSLTAIETAVRALAEHRVDAALAGGVNVTLHPNKYLMLSQGQFISSKGHCESFGEGGDGYIPGEGVGVLFLKRLSDAERDGDHVYGVIKGAALNHGGRASGYTVPNPKAQSRVIAKALQDAGIHPETISYLEAHGTGTKLGDPIEIAGLSAAYGELTAKKEFCRIGSVKSNIGHCESAAGVAGVTKVMLQMQHRKIVPSLHSDIPNASIDFAQTPFVLNHALRDWERPMWNGNEVPRRAGVSSFGAGGSNAHIILEEYCPPRKDRPDSGREPEEVPIVLSAKREDALRLIVENLRSVLAANSVEMDVRDIAYTLQTGREPMEFRLAMIVQSTAELVDKLTLFLEGRADHQSYYADIRHHREALGGLADDEDFRKLLHSWWAGKKHARILDFWVKGGNVDWAKLHRDRIPSKVSLPVYPFARERYWLPVPKPVEAPTVPALASPMHPDLQVETFEEVWQEKALPARRDSERGRPPIRTLVCFLSNPEYQQRFRDEFGANSPECEVVFVSRFPEQTTESLKRELRNIREQHGGIDAIVHLWALDDPAFVRDPASIVHTVQAMVAAKLKPQLLLLGGLAQTPADRCFIESWLGFERSLKLLLPETRVTVVAAETFSELIREIACDGHTSVLYSDGRRHVCEIRQRTLRSGDGTLRNGGTYAITGGCGGLGGVLAKYLARRYRANLILIGRSPWDESRQRIVDEVAQVGGHALYVSADICREESLKSALLDARSRFGEIHGVIHAAGSRQSESIVDKDVASFQSVLRPKVEGTQVLDRVFASDPLDFVCYFSSSSAILGDFGSCDYAVGNRFLMAHAAHRNRQRKYGDQTGITVAINWPLWREGTMGFEDAAQTEMYLKSSGQRMLESEEGLEVFERVLSSGLDQCLVLAGHTDRIHRFLGIASASPDPALPAELANLDGNVIGDLEQCVSRILKIPAQELDVAENWADFGFDSVTLAEFAEELTRHFAVEINPVQFYSYPTIAALANYLLAEHNASVRKLYSAEKSSEASEPPTPSEPARQAPVTPVEARSTPDALEPIAIIGLSGRFPKCRSIDELWQVLAGGRDAVEEISADRFDWQEIYGKSDDEKMKTAGKWCGCIPGVHEFDPLFFEISPREAEAMDPRQRLLLMEAWNALEDAGYGVRQLRQNRIGMFVGVESGEYATVTGENAGLTANHDAILAARLSYFLNLRGPNMAINTACSSGLVAAHLACQSLRSQECTTAIAAGVSVLLKPDAFALMGQAGMLSADGKCFTFDKRANGIVPAEAVVAVVLKRLSEAERDGDPIYAVIKGSGINYDGKTNGITAPSGVSQTELLNETYKRCSIRPDDIDYIVTHGTATQLGDPIEVNALFEAFKGQTTRTGYCALTSNKANLGHTMAASGLVSLVNLVQALRHETIPATIHCENENSLIPWDKSPFYINKRNRAWARGAGKARVGAVSSFGMSGTNTHVVVQEYVAETRRAASPQGAPALLVLSAKTAQALSRRVQDLVAWMQASDAARCTLAQLSYTLLTGRQHFQYRCAIVASDLKEAERLFGAIGSESFAVISRSAAAPNDDTRDLLLLGKQRESLLKLAEKYTQGCDLDWEDLFAEYAPQRIHLPAYPFDRTNYGAQPFVSQLPVARRKEQPEFQGQRSARNECDLDTYLVDLVAGHLKLPTGHLEFDRELDEYGLDSIEAATLVAKLRESYEGIPQSIFLECRTLNDIRDFLRQNCQRQVEVSTSVRPSRAAARSVSDVSIVGMAGLFPGAPSIDAFIEVLKERRVVTSALPERRKWLLGLSENITRDNPFYGGYLDGVEFFDHGRFKLSPDEARAMDPQLRKLLEVIDDAVADAGTTTRDFRKVRTGLYVATKGNSGYQEIAAAMGGQPMPSETPALYANRISNIFNLEGPSEVVDTGCSSFLVAIKHAITALKEGRCEQAIVAAAELDLSPTLRGRRDGIGLYTRASETKSFGIDSDGYVKSEAVGAIIIKLADAASRDGSPVYANIKGVGVCHGGKAPLKWYSPNIRGQVRSIEEALGESGIDPGTVMYVEAEANGSQLGDASEVSAIRQTYGNPLKAAARRMRIGSLKPLIGHAENASTFTALVKLIYSMRVGRIQEVYGFGEINKGIELDDALEVPREEVPWPRLIIEGETVPRRGAVHSLAVGGVNAHLILEEPARFLLEQDNVGQDWRDRNRRSQSDLPLKAIPDSRSSTVCWHEMLAVKGPKTEHEPSAIGAVVLAPRWAANGKTPAFSEPVDYSRVLVFCDFRDEISAQMRAMIEGEPDIMALADGISPVDRRFISYTRSILEAIQHVSGSDFPARRKPALMQVVVPDGIDSLHLQGIGALLRTARKEDSRFIGQLIVLDSALPAEAIAECLRENMLHPADTLVRYIENERRVQVWAAIPQGSGSEASRGSASMWKPGGVYLISGGAGGLGAIVARDIARQAPGVTVILAGRSPVSPKIVKTADEAHDLGARVIYEQVDIADKGEVDRLVKGILEDCGELSGIIHCAGIVEDNKILNKSSAEVENVLRPKVSGLCNLDEATRSLPLDCFILFSSVAAVFGNPGQADYAAGNSFMNGFCTFRNHLVSTGERAGRTLAINWPLWAEGGMDATAEAKAFWKRKHHVLPLPTKEGLRIMEGSLGSSDSEVCILYGEIDHVLESVREGRF